MDFERQRELYNACDPRAALDVDDPRNIDLDAVTGGEVRGQQWAKTMVNRIRLSDQPLFMRLSGLPGSGKSTEFRRLRKQLDDEGFLTVLIDAEKEIDLASPIDSGEVVAVVAYEVEAALLTAEGRDPSAALSAGYGQRVRTFLTKTNVELAKLVAQLGPTKITAELKTNATIRQLFRRTLDTRKTEFLALARDYVGELQTRATKTKPKGVVVLFDSLEKLRGTVNTWNQVVESADITFVRDAAEVRLPVHTIYTVPTALLSRSRRIEFMPAVKIRNRDGSESKPGVNSLRRLVYQRIPREEDRKALFGSEEDQSRLLDRLIGDSGGYLRNLVESLQKVVEAQEHHPIDETFVRRLFLRQVDSYKRVIFRSDHGYLAHVDEHKELIPEDDSQSVQQASERLLTENVILHYQNDTDWFDLHPAAREVLVQREQLASKP